MQKKRTANVEMKTYGAGNEPVIITDNGGYSLFVFFFYYDVYILFSFILCIAELIFSLLNP